MKDEKINKDVKNHDESIVFFIAYIAALMTLVVFIASLS